MNLDFKESDGVLLLFLKGDYLNFDSPQKLESLLSFIANSNIKSVKIETTNLTLWDSSLLSVLFQIAKAAEHKNIKFDFVSLPNDLKHMLQLALTVDRKPTLPKETKEDFFTKIGHCSLMVWNAFNRGCSFISDATKSFIRLISHKAIMRPVDFLFALDACGPKAVGIVSLISFMVGLILAFVGAIQLKTFGAQIYVASLVTIGMIRIMGAIMAGIIMAGRTGASYAATIGTMQVNEEIDALKTMGIPITDFLVLPRLCALVIAMPLLTMLADFVGMLGGAFVGVVMLDIAPEEYWKYAWNAFGLKNFLVGVFHGLVFGYIIALCGCYYGINCGRNADSVGVATTKAVVSSIVWMIVITGIITVICEGLGL